jgi:hypothetical protein
MGKYDVARASTIVTLASRRTIRVEAWRRRIRAARRQSEIGAELHEMLPDFRKEAVQAAAAQRRALPPRVP